MIEVNKQIRNRYHRHRLRLRSTHRTPLMSLTPVRISPPPRVNAPDDWIACYPCSCCEWRCATLKVRGVPSQVHPLLWSHWFVVSRIRPWSCPWPFWPFLAFTLPACWMPTANSRGSPDSCTCLRRSLAGGLITPQVSHITPWRLA